MAKSGQDSEKQAGQHQKMQLLQERIEKIKTDFVCSFPGRIGEFDALMDDLYGLDAEPKEVIRQIAFLAHKLHGLAGSFGFDHIGEIASKLELSALSYADGEADADIENVETQIIALMDEIHANREAA